MVQILYFNEIRRDDEDDYQLKFNQESMNYDPRPSSDSGFLLWQMSNLWQKKINELLAQHDITHVQYLLLATIVWMEDQNIPVNQKSLASHARSHKMMTSKVLRNLERNGFVIRSTDDRDSRHKYISLTSLGSEKYESVKNLVKDENKSFFEKIERNRFSLKKIFVDIIEENKTFSPSF